jgi:hypothetical protein
MWQIIKNLLLEFLKKEFIKVAIANLIKSAWMLDFRVWAVELIAGYLFEEIAKPLVNLFFRKSGYIYEVVNGKHTLKEINSATNSGDWGNASNNV